MRSQEKKNIRKKMLDTRKQISAEEIDKLSEIIIDSLTKLSIYRESKNVMLYLSFGNEVDSYRLIERCHRDGKKTIVPVCKKEGVRIIPSELIDVEEELKQSKFGYMEPKEEFIRPLDLEEIDIIIIPGISFDKRCYRIGYGAGYYDRFLAKSNYRIPTIGVAFDFQIIDNVPVEDFDIPLDYIITEKRIIVR